ncbi:MAG: transposase [Prevotellaceae bacterium]|nr:transposase [Prevotellaceae bacterium]
MVCTDKLTGFVGAVKSIFPDAAVLICIVRQIRNSIKYAAGKNQKEFIRDLKLVYRDTGKAQVEAEPDNPELKWGDDSPIIIKSRRDNWDRFPDYFHYPDDSARMIHHE